MRHEARHMRNLTTAETLELGAAIGRQAAAAVLATGNPRCGSDLHAIDETEEVIRAIDLRLGDSAGSEAAHALRAAMARRLMRDCAASLLIAQHRHHGSRWSGRPYGARCRLRVPLVTTRRAAWRGPQLSYGIALA